MRLENSNGRRRNLFGIAIIIVAVVLLLHNLGYLSGAFWSVVWPSLLILLGFAIVLRRRDLFCCCCYPFRKKHTTE
jgi:hypothetical protein